MFRRVSSRAAGKSGDLKIDIQSNMFSDKDFVISGTVFTKGTVDTFQDAVTVWINKPHVANRRLCGTKILRVVATDALESAEKVASELSEGGCGTDELQQHDESGPLEVNLRESSCERYTVILRELVPKQTNKYPSLLEAVIHDKESPSASFFPLKYIYKNPEAERKDVADEIAYRWKYIAEGSASIQLEISSKSNVSESTSSHTIHWLRDTLTPKIARWSEESNLNTSVKSLRLVGVDRYSQKYSQLKEKYGAQLVKNWTEKTDPRKFVYEDIAIAAYLLLLWEDERRRTGREKKQTFVDLGCGNGLLVYLLTKEGHAGLGIDLRRRNIWDTFDCDVNLEERPITPSADNLFPDFDWLIGNHSDELTPWIPVITARSSYTCSYFVLPCCHHDFNRRFSSKVKGMSQYHTYLSYVSQIGEVCGFQVEEDVLRIPSTKRVCQIGRQRTYTPDLEESIDKKRQEFIDTRCAAKSDTAVKTTHKESANTEDISPQTENGNSSKQTSLKRQCGEESDANRNDVRENLIGPELSSQHRDFGSNLAKAGLLTGQHEPNLSEKMSHDEPNSSQKLVTSNEVRLSAHSPDSKSTRNTSFQAWATDFQARDSVERVRNCQKVGVATKDKVVHAVFDAVLNAKDATVAVGQDGKPWRKGGSIPLSEVAQMLDKSTREELKSECGGVQTLLRNHNYIFQVSGGKVQLRDFSVENPWSQHSKAKSRKVDPASRVKTSLCWFHDNHPDGCPRHAENCTFAHGTDELRPREQKS